VLVVAHSLSHHFDLAFVVYWAQVAFTGGFIVWVYRKWWHERREPRARGSREGGFTP
jgi:hypothetical protein